MSEDKKTGDSGLKKGEFSIPYGSAITRVPEESPREERSIPYGSVATPQQPASAQPAGSGSGASDGASGGGSGGDGTGGGQSGSGGSQASSGEE